MRRSQPRAAAGFTLIELMIVVIILGVLASIVIAGFGRSQSEASNGTFISNLRAYASSFAVYNHQKGQYPPERAAGVHPAEMTGNILAEEWTRPTPIGGQWDWDNGQFGVIAGVSVVLPNRTPAEMLDIDRVIDDGDLATGVFRSRTDGYIYIIQQ
jgi:prepilin-type N-terminal cleavage/methylation domain-containing protein